MQQLTNHPTGHLMPGPTIEVLSKLALAVTALAEMVDNMPGRTRPRMDTIAADLLDVHKLLGLAPPDAPNPRPTSAWPEGTATEP